MPDIAVYPGSFDHITNGHLDLIQRALKVFDRIIVAVATNAFKKSLFAIEERWTCAGCPCRITPVVTIDTFDGLLVKYATRQKARAVLRALRAVTDFEYEFQLAMMNRRLEPEIRDGVFHDRPALGLPQLQHPQGSRSARRRHCRHGAGNRVSKTAGKIRLIKVGVEPVRICVIDGQGGGIGRGA